MNRLSIFIVVTLASSTALAGPPKRTSVREPHHDDNLAQPSGYVHIVQPTDRLPKIAAFYHVIEEALREVNADLFAHNEAQTGHRMIINEPIILPLGCIIPRNAAYARRADALDMPAAPTVVTTHDSPPELNALRTGSGWTQQYSGRRSSRTPAFTPAQVSLPHVGTSEAMGMSTTQSQAPLAYGVTTSDLPSPRASILGASAGQNRHVHLSSVFGMRGFRHHKGIDIPFDENTPVVAAADGIVERADHDFMGYGNYVIVNHGRYETRYAHLNRILVTVGQPVLAGSTILGLSGSTGHSTGPHLHFEVRIDGEPVDPIARFLPGVQTMLAGMANASGRNDLQGGYGSLNYTFEGDRRWQLNRTW